MSKEPKGFAPGSKKWKKMMAKVYGLGGAVVILGALFKIQHYPGASLMLIIGLGTETIIFTLSAFEPLHDDPKWELVYPELAEHDADEEGEEGHIQELEEEKIESDVPVVQQLDNLLEDAKIDSALIASLGDGLRGLKDSTSKLADISDASVATNEYVDSMKSASRSVSDLNDSYIKASESFASLTGANAVSVNYSDQLEKASQNLSALNAVYEMQLNSTNAQVENSKRFFTGIDELLSNLNDSVEDSKKYRKNIAELSENMSALNTVYGNMLTAMNLRPSNQ
jgi:gliding motility-associated protein GldL